MSSLAPVVLFVYNRPEHTARTLASLAENQLANATDLIIFSDGPKSSQEEAVRAVRNIISLQKGFRSIDIFESEMNKGLASSVINGVSKVLNEHDSVIVMEDDLETSPFFLDFMNEAIRSYAGNQAVFSISGYNIRKDLLPRNWRYRNSIVINPRAGSWGWATWSDRWNKVEWGTSLVDSYKPRKLKRVMNRGGKDMYQMLMSQRKGTIDSWAIRFCFNQLLHHGVTVSPVESLVRNIGFDGSGVHCDTTAKFDGSLSDSPVKVPIKLPGLNRPYLKAFRSLHSARDIPILKRISRKIRKLIG